MIKEHHSAGGVLINNVNGVFLIHKISRDEWLLPKGTVEKGERLIETAAREVQEETGYANIKLIRTEPITRTEFSYQEPDTDILVNKYVTYYLFEIEGNYNAEATTQMASEDLEGTWFSFENAIKKVSYKELRDTLSKAQTLLS